MVIRRFRLSLPEVTVHPRAMQVGDLIADRFELLDEAGSGGMGTVYRAREQDTGRTVALKVIHDPETDATAQRFKHEATILGALDHPHIVQYVTYGVHYSAEPYLVMEWLEGESLQQ